MLIICRLAFFPKGCADVFSFNDMVAILEDLQKSMGGDGNGIYFLGTSQIQKSAKKSIKNLLKRGPWGDGFIFHTRKATNGDVTDRNCHPFKLPLYKTVIAHNGIWSAYKIVYPFVKDLCTSDTDSEMLGFYLSASDFEDMPTGGGAIIALYNGQLHLGKTSFSDLGLVKYKEYLWIQSEEPPNKYYDTFEELDDGIQSITPILESLKKLKTSMKRRYYYNKSNIRSYNNKKKKLTSSDSEYDDVMEYFELWELTYSGEDELLTREVLRSLEKGVITEKEKDLLLDFICA